MMETDDKTCSEANGWTYTEIVVHDGDRILKPTHVCSDEIAFDASPMLLSTEIRICIKNGNRHTTRSARVLAHDPCATRIPILLIEIEHQSKAKMTA